MLKIDLKYRHNCPWWNDLEITELSPRFKACECFEDVNLSHLKPLEEKLVQAILANKKLYYAGVPEITDEEYDSLEDLLRQVNPDSYVLSMVGYREN